MNIYYRYSLVIIWMLVIFLFSAQVADTSSAQSAVFVDAIKSLNVGLSEDILTFLTRKSAHITAYFMLGLLVYNVVRYYRISWRAAFLGIAITASYAATDEIHQTFVAGRSGQVSDVVLDTVAASIAIILLHLYTKRKSRHTKG